MKSTRKLAKQLKALCNRPTTTEPTTEHTTSNRKIATLEIKSRATHNTLYRLSITADDFHNLGKLEQAHNTAYTYTTIKFF